MSTFASIADNQTITGTSGDDRYIINHSGVSIQDTGGHDTVELSWMYSPAPTRYELGAGLENLTLTGYAPSGIALVGNDQSNIINAEDAYSAVLDGGAGADTLIGGEWNDTLIGGSGYDTLMGGWGADTYIIEDYGDIIVEADVEEWEADTVHTTLNSYTLGDNIENLVFVGSGPFHGTGNALGNQIVGGAGNDILDGGTNDASAWNGDQLIGGEGNDLYRLDATTGGHITEKAGEGTDAVEFFASSHGNYYSRYMGDNVEIARFGGLGNIELQGNDLDNEIMTAGGNDTLDGGLGSDTMVGGRGNDTYIVSTAGDVIDESADGGVDTVISASQFYQLNAFVENLVLDWGPQGLNADGNDLDNRIEGNENANVIHGLGGNDTIDGYGGANVLDGGAGDDWVYGGGDDDKIVGGAGNDSLIGWAGRDIIDGGAGSDVVEGSLGSDTINGGDGYDYVSFQGARTDYSLTKNADGSVTITDKWYFDGDDGSDLITNVEAFHFREGVITLQDMLELPDGPLPYPQGAIGETGATGPQGPKGDTGATGPQGPQGPAAAAALVVPFSNSFTGTAGSDVIAGNNLANVVAGLDGNDVLKGLAGNDRLYGGNDADKLCGGKGNDALFGGAGKDSFVFNTAPTSGRDAIKDFRIVDDTIHLDNAFFTKVGSNGGLKSYAFHTSKTGKAHDANDRIIYDNDSGLLYYDGDGTGTKAGVCFASISKGLKMTASDFYIV